MYRKYLLAVSVSLDSGDSFISSCTKWGYDNAVTEKQITRWEENLLKQFRNNPDNRTATVSSVAVFSFQPLHETTDKIKNAKT